VDIYGAVDLDTILPNLFVSKLRGKKVVYDAHEYFTQVPEVVNRKKVQKIWEWIEGFSVPKVDRAYTVGGGIASLLSTKYNIPVEVVRNLPILSQYNNMDMTNSTSIQVTQTEKFILYQGALNDGRGLKELIQTSQQIELPIYIVGEGDDSQALRDLSKKISVESQVKFLGYQTPKALQSITQEAYIGYNLLENKGLSYYYSLSNKFFDYMMAGVPSLNPPFPEYELILNEYKIGLTSNLSIDSIVYNIEKLLKEEDLYQMMQDNCRQARLIYNWESEEKKLLQLYGFQPK